MAKRNRRDDRVSDLFSQLPDGVKSNILSRLPVKIMLQLKCFMDDPYTRKLSTDPVILASHSNSNVVSFLTLVQVNNRGHCRFHFSEYNAVRDTYKLTKPINYPHLKIYNRGSRGIIVGSCNGLVCYVKTNVLNKEAMNVYVFNPVTRERLSIRSLRFTSVDRFGYHPVTKEYKVVCIYYDGEGGEVEVYTLGTGRWTSVGKVTSLFKAFSHSHGVLVNGALHWYDHDGRIASIDLAAETFDLVPSPPSVTLNPVDNNSSYDLCTWKESLCVVKHDYPSGILYIWVRNNDDQSWGQELRVPFAGEQHGLRKLSVNDTKLNHDDCTFITHTENGKVLLWYNHKLLASYNLKKQKRRVYGNNNANYFNDIVLHVKSFVSLKELGEDSKIMGEDLCFLSLYQMDEEKNGAFRFEEYEDVANVYKATESVFIPLINLTNKGADNIIVGSSNGLVCYADHHKLKFDPICVFNPVTSERLRLTPLRSVKKLYSPIVNGFGYHPVTKEYKVVRIYYEAKKGAGGEVEVYTLGTGEWRRVGKVSALFNTFLDFPGVLVNGALHWLDRKGSIASFDLATEIFEEVPSPSSLTLVSDDDSPGNRYNLCALREHLCVLHYFRESRIHIWELNKDQSWGMEFRFAVKVDPPLCANDKSLKHDCCTPITFTKSGKLLLWYNYTTFVSYDPKNRETIAHGVYEAGHFNEIVPHVKSFVSLKALGEQNAVSF